MWHVRGRREMHTVFGGVNQKETDHFERSHTWVVNIKMNINEIRREGSNWINLTRDWKKWTAPVKGVMNFWVLQNARSP